MQFNSPQNFMVATNKVVPLYYNRELEKDVQYNSQILDGNVIYLTKRSEQQSQF